ncbi:hypothetical protein GcM3_085027 [Golovinomyces cichoracearum]|uniref:Uncharacterized protein n=1 Tax=Golovinomyces cichoracearum TaxID=62708 RepID=A0A420ILK7_9PEZI|nr:hypothetical protein GcM3_085027 [Golovinomyces cichoracearum]
MEDLKIQDFYGESEGSFGSTATVRDITRQRHGRTRMEPKPSKPPWTSTSEINEEKIDDLLTRRIEQALGPLLSRLEGLSTRCNEASTINIPENAPTQSNFTPPSLHDRK